MGKMSPDIALQRQIKKAMALLGDAAPKIEITKAVVKEARANKPNPFYEAEAVLLFLEKPARFLQKECKRKECGEWFGTNYRAVAYCSDNCRIKELAAVGIEWDPSKRPEERWGGEEPLLIPPAALKALLALAQRQAEQPVYEQEDDEVIPPELSEKEYTDLSISLGVVPDTISLPPLPLLTSQFVLKEVNFDVGF